MSRASRTPETCPYRRCADAAGVHCGLLEDLSGLGDQNLVGVTSEMCAACCDSSDPTPTDLNPVVASLLFQLAENVIAAGGHPVCDAAKAHALREFAESSLPVLYPDEPDIVSTSTKASGDADAITIDRLAELVPAPAPAICPVQSWSVAVTTAPRRQETLDVCLERLRTAGWAHPRLMIDGPVQVAPGHSELPRTQRDESIGAWAAYYLALTELVYREPAADAYLLLQDDGLLPHCTAIRSWLETVLWPREGPCLASLYCSVDDTRPDDGWAWYAGRWCLGAVAFVFSPSAARAFLSDDVVCRHRFRPEVGEACIDSVIGEWAERESVPILFPTPSLVQHIGEVSTLWAQQRALGVRRASRFLGDELTEQPDTDVGSDR